MSESGLHLIKPRTEAEARADRAMRTVTPERIEPTPEDLEISRRTVRRLMRWSQEHNLATAATPERHINGVKLAGITRRAMQDAMHFAPEEMAGAGGIR